MKRRAKKWDAEIVTFLHCATCYDEVPVGDSPAKYARLSIGGTPGGRLVVGCVRHGCTVVTFNLPTMWFRNGRMGSRP